MKSVATVAVVGLILLVAGLVESKKKLRYVREKGKQPNTNITDIVTMEFEIQNYNGDAEDFHGKIEIGLFGGEVPITVVNFKELCRGIKIKNSRFKYPGSHCHRMVKDMLIQCGDIVTKDGSGSISCFGDKFRDEGFGISHSSGGIVSMANQGPDTNGSQFFILFNRARYLDGAHVAFGKVLKGFDVLDRINELGNKKNKSDPLRKVEIKTCSVNELAKPFPLTSAQMATNDLEA